MAKKNANKKTDTNHNSYKNYQWYRYNCAPPPYRTLADMTEQEISALEIEYNCEVVRPAQLNG